MKRVGEAFPLRERAGAGHAQRVQRRAGDRERVRRLRLAEAKGFRCARRGGERALRGVVESSRAHGRFVREPTLHLIGDGERGQQFLSGRVRVFGRRQYGREVVARVAGLARCEVGVVEVEIANECAVVEGSAVGGGFAAADQRAEWPAAKLLELRADCGNRRRPQRAEGAPERIEDAKLQFLARQVGDVLPGTGDDEACQPGSDRHETSLLQVIRPPRRRT